MSAEDYSNHILKVAVAQICQAIGWHSIQSTPLELMTDILSKYLQQIARKSNRYAELCKSFFCLCLVINSFIYLIFFFRQPYRSQY